VHAVAGGVEQVGERRAERGMATVPDVQRAGRVRGDELDDDALPAAELAAPVGRALLGDAQQFLVIRGRASTMAWATSRGLRRALLASCIAALVAKSPCAGSRVRSTTGAGASASAGRNSAGSAASASRTRFSIRYFKVLPSRAVRRGRSV
jgi:hypothetical protein